MGEEPAWVRIQKKTFTRWCNNYLQQRDIKLEDLSTDLQSGVSLHTLLEILGNEEVLPKPNRRAKMKLQMVENLNSCLRYIKGKNIQLVNIGAEDIHDGKIKLILGLIWTLILRFQIMAEDDESAGARQALLDWCNSVLNPQGLHVKNFTSDWQNGRCFCGLVNAIEPNRIPLDTVPASDAENNMNKAFDAAEEEFGFPQVLDAIDVIENPDDLSIMTYVSYFRAYMLANSSYGPNCFAEGPGLTEATTFEKAEFKITTMNEENEPVTRGGARVLATLKDDSGAEVTKVVIADNRDGTYACYYIAERPGAFTLEIQVQKAPIKDSPFKPTVKPGEPSPAMCEAEGPGLSNATAGEPAIFTVITKDVSGNQIPRGGANVSATLKDSRGDIPVTVVDNGDGTYSASYVPVTSGNTTLEVNVSTQFNGSGPIKNSPFTVAVTPNKPSGANSVASGPGLTKAVAGEENPFTVQTRDKFDNDVKTGGANVGGQLVNDATGETVPVVVKDNGDGTYAASYPGIKNAGTYTLTPTVEGENIKDSPFKVVVDPAGPDASAFTWDGLNLDADGNLIVVAGTTESFSVTARDAFGNQQPSGGLNVAGTIGNGPAEVAVNTSDNNDGTYTLAFTPEKAGQYQFTTTLDGTPIGGHKNPFGVVVVPAEAYGPTSVATGSALATAAVGSQNDFLLTTHDKFDNLVTKGGAPIACELKSSTGEDVPVEIVDNGNGTYGLAYPAITKAGSYTLSPKVNGELVKDAPFSVTVAAGDYDPNNTGVEFPNPNQIGRRGPRVSVKDNQGNLRAGAGDVVEADLTPKVKIPNVRAVDNGDGTFDINYPPNLLPGEYKVNIRVNGRDTQPEPFRANLESSPVSEEHGQALDESFGEDAALFKRLFGHATDAERDAAIAAIKKLSQK